MDLEELLRREGLDAEGLKKTVAWARDRAEELVAPLVADAELGPLLDDQWEEESSPNLMIGLSPQHRLDLAHGAEIARQAESERLAEIERRTRASGVEVAGVGPLALADLADQVDREREHEQEPVEEVTTPRPFPEFVRKDESRPSLPPPRSGRPMRPLPRGADVRPRDDSMQIEVQRQSAAPQSELPPTHTDEIVEDEIELLDDEDLELVEESLSRGRIPRDTDGADDGDEGEVPEWKQALMSAELGGGVAADRESGLLRLPGEERPKKKPAPEPVDEEPSQPVDVSDLD